MKMAKDLKVLLEKKKNIILKDFNELSKLDITNLTITSISDNAATLSSNYLDDKLGIFSKSFRNLRVSINIDIEDKNKSCENWFLTSTFKYLGKQGDIKNSPIFDENDWNIDFKYEVESENFSLVKNEFQENNCKILLTFTENILPKTIFLDFFDDLTIKGKCRKVENCSTYSVEVFNNGNWEKIVLEKNIKDFCDYELNKNSIGNVKYI